MVLESPWALHTVNLHSVPNLNTLKWVVFTLNAVLWQQSASYLSDSDGYGLILVHHSFKWICRHLWRKHPVAERVVQWLTKSTMEILAPAAGWHSSLHAKLVFHSSVRGGKKRFSGCFLKCCCYYAGAGGELIQTKWTKCWSCKWAQSWLTRAQRWCVVATGSDWIALKVTEEHTHRRQSHKDKN